MLVLGFDPGVRNFAWASYDGHPQAWGWLPGNHVGECDYAFINAALEVLDRIHPDAVVIERFNFRGMQSAESEHVNHLIAKLDLLARMRGYPVSLPMPSHWKVPLKTKDFANGALGLFPDTKFDAVHQADACGLAMYIHGKRSHPDYDPETDTVAKTTSSKKKVRAKDEMAASSLAAKIRKPDFAWTWKTLEEINHTLDKPFRI